MKERSSRARRAAQMYLDNLGEGRQTGIAMRVCAERYGISVGTVHAAVRQLRNEQRAQPDDEVTL